MSRPGFHPPCRSPGAPVRRARLPAVTLAGLRVVLALAVTGCASSRARQQAEAAGHPRMKISVPLAARTVLRTTVMAAARAPVSTTCAGLRMVVERVAIALPGGMPATWPNLRQGQQLPAPGTAAFEALLDRAGMPAPVPGSVEFLVDGPAFFPAFYRDIAAARRSIDVQFYIFDNDTVARDVANRLRRKSRDVPVRVLFDPIGSEAASSVTPPPATPQFKSLPDLVSHLAGGEQLQVRLTSNPLSVSDHTKLAVFDGRAAYLGGMNIGAEYRYHWHDLMVRVEGPIVADLARLFDAHWEDEDWRHQWGLRGWFEKKRPPPPPATARPQAPLRMLLTDTLRDKREVLKATLAAIRCARERVWLENPYFAADEITTAALRAAERGVDVRIIFPGTPDNPLMREVNLVELRGLLKAGVKVYEYPGMTHLKAAICDDWATFGSANYDALSLYFNDELNLATADPAIVADLIRRVFEPDFRRSPRLDPAKTQTPRGPLTELLGDQF